MLIDSSPSGFKWLINNLFPVGQIKMIKKFPGPFGDNCSVLFVLYDKKIPVFFLGKTGAIPLNLLAFYINLLNNSCYIFS